MPMLVPDLVHYMLQSPAQHAAPATLVNLAAHLLSSNEPAPEPHAAVGTRLAAWTGCSKSVSKDWVIRRLFQLVAVQT